MKSWNAITVTIDVPNDTKLPDGIEDTPVTETLEDCKRETNVDGTR